MTDDVTFPHWGWNRRAMAREIAAVCGVDLHTAESAVESALHESLSYGQITFRPNGAGGLAWSAQDEARFIPAGLVAIPEAVRRTPQRTPLRDGHRSCSYEAPKHERLLTLSAWLIPRAERARLVRTWLDHLDCERDTDNQPRRTALSIVFRGVLPIAVRARYESAVLRLGRLADSVRR